MSHTCRDEILDVIQGLHLRRSGDTFGVLEILEAMQARGTRFAESTIRGYISSKMCVNAPFQYGTRYHDLERLDRNTYRLARPGIEQVAGSSRSAF